VKKFARALIAISLGTIIIGHSIRAKAEDPAGSMFSFNGFGTVGAVHSSEDKADFTATEFEPNGAGYTRSWSASVDSLVGGQVTVTFTPQLSAVLQVIAQQNYDDSYTPYVEWANLKYLVTPDFDVRIGRVVLPTFLVSDSRDVGYSNPWVRPPPEVYELNPLTNLDGADASYRLRLGELTNTVQADYGRELSYKFAGGAKSDATSTWGVFDNAEYASALLHIGYVASVITLNSAAALFDGLRQFGPQGTDLANEYVLANKNSTIFTIAASYDPGTWFAMSEWARSRSDSFIGVSTGWYVSGGYRFGRFTPYLTHAQVTERRVSDPGLSLSGLPANLVSTAAALNVGLNELLATRPVQYTSTIGLRWDFLKNFDLKVQLDRMALGADSSGTLSNVQPGFQFGSVVYLFSAAVDFVF
jgi:hypothetical protein